MTSLKSVAIFLNKQTSDDKRSLAIYFALAYAAQGICQHFCLIAQPLDFYLMKSCGMNAVQVSQLLAFLMVPWLIKPLYGCLSDLLPLYGYHTKSYLILAYAFSFLGFIGVAIRSSFLGTVSGLDTPLFACIFLSTMGMAFATTLSVGLTVRAVNNSGRTRGLFSTQAVCYYVCNIVSMLLGGWLCQNFGQTKAVPAAALVASVPALIAAVASWRLIAEKKESSSIEKLSETLSAMKLQLVQKKFWLAALFICAWNFSPGLSTPLYFFESNQLHFSQALIGQLGAINAFGMLVGACLFRWLEERIDWKKVLYTSILLNIAATSAYVFLSSEMSAVVLEIMRGISTMCACLSVYGVVAGACLKRVESSAMAVLISVYNLAGQAGNICGAQLYGSYCKNTLWPLVLVSASTTLLCCFIVPLIISEKNKAA